MYETASYGLHHSKPPVPWHSAVKQLARGTGTTSLSSTSNSFLSSSESDSRQMMMSSLVQPSQLQFENFCPDAPNVDLEGGQLLDVEEHEEMDTDGWRQRVFTYRILAADGCTEVTKTIRTKIKLDCTSMYRRLQVTNGVEAKVEEKCERVVGDIHGLGPVQSLGYNQRKLTLDPNDAQDKAIYDTLTEVPETFKKLLNKEQDSFMKLFPELFSKNLTTKSTLFPIQNTELIHNPDGSTTRRTRSSKSYSQSFSTQDVYINGVKQDQMSQRRFRAFVEYKGPDYGFRVKVSDNASDDLSEDETEDDDKISRTHSELTDVDSDVIGLGDTTLRPEVKKRHEKAWFAAKELIDSEQRYVDKLRLLSDFQKRVSEEKVLDKDRLNKLFANIASLYQFHNTHFLPQLMEAGREWEHTKRIANVVRKQAPFLKMYSEYTNNYDRATKIYEEAKKKKRFAEIVQEIEKMPDCEGLPLGHHLICPVQRVMRYQLLLQEYKKHMVESDIDYEDTTVALQLVLQAATHANDMMKKLERFGKVITVQEELGDSISLVSPGRELLRQDTVQKISSKTEKAEERTLFLFNDFILLASERRLGMAKYKLRAVFHPCYTQVCDGDNLEREHSFYLRGSDGTGPQRCVELFCESASEKEEWVEALCKVIDDCRANSATFGGSQRSNSSETNNNNCKESKNCSDCDAEFSIWSRGIKCGKCRRKMCKKCFGRYRTESKNSRICEACVKHTGTDGLIRSPSNLPGARQNLLAVPAKGGDIVHAGFVKFRGSLGKTFERYFVVRKDCCLYSYETPNDSHALVMLPLTGCAVRMCGEQFTFSLRVGARRQYTITVETQDHQTKWMALLDLTATAQLNNP